MEKIKEKQNKHFFMLDYHKELLKKEDKIWDKLLLLFFVYGWVLFVVLLIILNILLFFLLPNVSWLKDIPIAQSSIIYDRNGWELYKIYSEKRTYVKYDSINKNMINAIVAWEDKRFWVNPWYDIIWIFRSVFSWLINSDDFSWTSTITQQLAKITYLSNERSIKRKIKELYLAIKINSNFSKEDVLEIYLNKVFFWWNSYWIEQSSKTFFWINASNLNVLQSSILASLPKAPTWLSPYVHKKELLWYPVIYSKENWFTDKKEILSLKDVKNNIEWINILKLFIDGLSFYDELNKVKICWINDNRIVSREIIVNKNKCAIIWYNELLSFFNSIHIEKNNNIVEYKTWRKDYILWRMFEDKYISSEEYKQAILSSFWFEFNKYSDNIKYPYFVMYVKDYLVKKYWEDILKVWGYRIYTSIDPIFQDKAEEIIKNQVVKNTLEFNAKNAAIISVYNKTWEILSFVWGVDYFDEENWGYNNMLLAKLQPGSIFKPFVYALAIIKKNLNAWSLLYDDKTTFEWWYRPNNNDFGFMWKMTLSRALNQSRNIPAVKLYYEVWWEDEILKFLDKFWVKSLSSFKMEYKNKFWVDFNYSAPMALWTGEMTPLELVQVYSTFANNWVKNELRPIIKITDSKWNILEDSSSNKLQTSKRIIDKDVAFKMNTILSNSEDRPVSWNHYLTIPWRKIAAKTWTSTKQYLSTRWTKSSKWEWYRKTIIAPKNLWTVWYTPQVTTVVWAWNTSWEELVWKAFWITLAWPIMRDFMEFAHKDLEVENW